MAFCGLGPAEAIGLPFSQISYTLCAEVALEFAAVCEMAEGPRKTATLAAWVQGLYPEGSPVPVLVGGAAVELYTGGAYVTGDLDFVGEVPGPVAAKLRREGFRKVGRHWIHEREQVFLEFPSRALEPGAERAVLRVSRVDVTTLRPEELILDRLRSLVFWRHREDGLNAMRLLWAQRTAVDRSRLKAGALEPEVLAALTPLLSLVKKRGAKPTPAQTDRWLKGVLR